MNAYDFDETIYDGESSVQIIISYLSADPKALKFVPGVMKVFNMYKHGKLSLEDFSGKYADIVRDYLAGNNFDFDTFVKKFWDKHEKNIKPFYFEKQRSDDCVISASPRFYIQEICSRIGIKNVVATEFNLKTGAVEKACFREGKISSFRQAFPNGVIDDFYTDSLNDEFLFPYAKRVFMVKGNKLTRIK